MVKICSLLQVILAKLVVHLNFLHVAMLGIACLKVLVTVGDENSGQVIHWRIIAHIFDSQANTGM